MIQQKNRNKLNKKNCLIITEKKKYIYLTPSTKFIKNTLKKTLTNFKLNYFWNQNFDKNRLKNFVFWCFKNYGQNKTVKVLEILKHLGFQYATKAGLSLSIDDLIIPPTKSKLLIDAELITRTAMIQYKNAQITNLERFQKIIETWHITSEKMKDDMIYHFKTTNIFNPLYMMAFSGARGNVSQVRQLVGMRGLMANPQGQILDFPIQSNFREGLTLTEYVISCYGARKGVVDTALRTANAGYLTRRLVDVAQHIIISNFDCGTNRGLIISEMKQGHKLLFSLRQRLLGRVLAKDVQSGDLLIAKKNEEISDNLSEIIASIVKTVIIRSPLTCKTTQFICQLCYGWSLAEGKLVGVGETVGIIAAQSIGEPGTQLTMRTFHTGGVFAGELLDQLIAPFDGIIKYNIYIPGNMIRTPQGKIAFLTRIESQFILLSSSNSNQKTSYTIPPYTILFIRNGETVAKNQLIAQLCTFSPSFKNSSDFIEYKIYSDLEGEIKSTNLKVLKKITEINDIMHQSVEWGYIWILSGKIYQLPFNSIGRLPFESNFQQKNYFFPIKGDFLTNSSILSEILWINNIENLRLTFEQKTFFYAKFTNNKEIYINNWNKTNYQWLKKWKTISKIYCLNNLNKSIKQFNNTFKNKLLVQNSCINIYSKNLLLFLTIDKIRYKKLGYFLFLKKNFKNIDLVKTKKKNTLRNTFKKVNFDLQSAQKKSKSRFASSSFDNQFFIPIGLESNSVRNQDLITSPKFFYQKLSNMFFEWFPTQQNQLGSGFIKLSEILLFKNKNQLKKEIRKKQQKNVKFQRNLLLLTFTKQKQKKLTEFNKIHQSFQNYAIRSYPASQYVIHKSLCLNQFNDEKKIKYLNSNYSFIFFYLRPFIQCAKQQLSQLKFIKTKNYFDNLLSFSVNKTSKKKKTRSRFAEELIQLKGNKLALFKRYTTSLRKKFDLKKQLINHKIFQKLCKYESNKYFRFISKNIKKDQLIKFKLKNKLKLLKVFNLNKKNYFLNKKKKNPLKKYISLNPISFLYTIISINNFLVKKNIYYKLQFIQFLKHQNKSYSALFHHQVQYNYFFTVLNINYLTKKLFYYLNIEQTNNKKFKRYTASRRRVPVSYIFSSFFQKFSNIFISVYNLPTTYGKNNIFSYKYICNQFSYINLQNIVYKQKVLLFKKLISKNYFTKLKENSNINNLKNFHSSFSYYIIKNQFRFVPLFQKKSVYQLENIYKKEIKPLSDYNIYKQKVLFIKQFNKNFISYLIKELNAEKNILNSKILVRLDDGAMQNRTLAKQSTVYTSFQKLIRQIKKQKNSIELNNGAKRNNHIFKKLNYLRVLFKQLIQFSNYIFKKKKQKLKCLKNYDYKQKNTEKIKFNNFTILNSIFYKKSVPILLIKYKKKELNSLRASLHPISIFNHFLIRKTSTKKNQNNMMLVNEKDYLINNLKNQSILKSYLIKLNSLNNIVINSYFKLISFKWLQIKKVIRKKKKFNPIFFKRLEFSKFINKNLIISNDKIQQNILKEELSMKLNSVQHNENKQKKKLPKNSKNKISTISEEKLLLYSRFSLIPKEYSKVYKKQISFLIFNPQQKILFNPFYTLLEIQFCFLWNSNNLSLFQNYFFFIKKKSVYTRKLKLKKTIKLLTLKNFLNIKKLETNKNILSKKNYLQKNNKFIFNLFQNLFNKEIQLFKNNRQGKFIPFELKNCYGLLKFNKKNPTIKQSGMQWTRHKLSTIKNIFHLSKKSKILLNKKWELLQNKKEVVITSQPGWVCKPIKNQNIQSNYSNSPLKQIGPQHLLNQFLEQKLQYNSFKGMHYIRSFNSISISYKFCEKNLIWLNYTFLKMIELVTNFSKKYYVINNLSIFSLHLFSSALCYAQYNQNLQIIKNKKENAKKVNNYYWLINKKSRFLKLSQSNKSLRGKVNSFKHFKNNYQITNGINKSDHLFFIVKVHEFVMNNYQNLSYFSNTNLLFLSKKNLFKISEKKYQANIGQIPLKNGLILKSQYHSIILNKQKLSQKLISKFANLETTFEQYFGIPSNKFSNILNKKNYFKINNDKKNFSTELALFNDNLHKNNKIINSNNFQNINTKYKIFKSQKSLKIFRYFLGSSIPITFDFSFKSSDICWNYFPNSNLSNLKFEKKMLSTNFLTYLIFKNKILNQIQLKKPKKFDSNPAIFINVFNCIKMLLRQPCIDWSAIQPLNMGYKKNIFLAPTKTLLLLSPQNDLGSNNPIALTKIFSGMKGEILYSLKNKKYKKILSKSPTGSKTANKFLFNEQKSERSLFLTKSDQICLKFKNYHPSDDLNNELNFFKKFNIFKNHKHIRGLKIFQIKSAKQIILIFKILQKIHNNCQFINQSIKMDLGLFIFQGDLLNTFYSNSNISNDNIENNINNKKTIKKQKNYMKSIIVNHSGQIIHLNQYKLTLRKGQPIFFSPNCIFHSYNSDFIEQNKPVLSLPYQQLKTGDIVQGIPKIEQLFEARLTFAGKLEYDNLTNILEIIFQTYKNKLTLKLAVRRSIELVQMIIVNSIQRIYRSQGVNISDKHLEIIVKQMTKKVEIIDSGQSGFLVGEHFDLDVVELWNSKLSKIKHVKYKPLILGISKASLQTDSFLSAASFQYTTRILSQAAFFKKRDFLKGLKENIIVGNIIPAGTGYLGNIEDLFETN
uniref:DNA-directed RNA polymerase n=1 Tax=Oedocladium carolinianum TaxID=55992 RepID=A0A8K1N3G4_9CHLO|nr:RNA polymerase beta'' subunit [Oedocladium carolinianum]